MIFQSILSKTINIFKNRNFILILAITLGLVFGEKSARNTEPLVLPLLALVITLSALSITSAEIKSLRKLPHPIITTLLLNYLVLGGVILLLTRWLIHDEELRTGLIVLAAVPPAPAIVPFSYSLKGDAYYSMIGLVAGYLAALVILPVIMVTFLGLQFIAPTRLLTIAAELIVVPVVVSRIILAARLFKFIEPWRNIAVNWSFFTIVFTLVGLNQMAFFGEYDVLIRLSIIAGITSFLMAYIIELVTRALGVKRETAISMALIGTLKNYGLAGGILISLFTQRAAIPPAIAVVFGILLVVWLGSRFKNHR